MEKKIMIVEDEPIIVMFYRHFLPYYGFRIVGCASNAFDAINLAETEKPDIIIMDISLEGEKDGIFAAHEIKARLNPNIIYITGNTDEYTKIRAMETMPIGYLTKPFMTSDLKKIIDITLMQDMALNPATVN